MKSIVAIIRQEKYQDVKNALLAVGCEGMSVSEVKGRGSQSLGKSVTQKEVLKDSQFSPKSTKIIKTFNRQKTQAYTGNIGDGKIFIYPIDNVIRIRTGEEGDSAV